MKRILAFILAALIAAVMGIPAAAADPKIDGLAGSDALLRSYLADPALGASWSENLRGGVEARGQNIVYTADIVPGQRVKDYIDLPVNAFTWKNGDPANAGGRLDKRQINDAKLAVKATVASGSKAVEDMTVDKTNGRVEIRYRQEFISVEPLDFEFTVYLSLNGKRYSDDGLTITGTLANEVESLWANSDYVDLADGRVALAEEGVPKIQVDVGNGVSFFTKLTKGKKYYGITSLEPDDTDLSVFREYPDVDHVLNVKTINLKANGDIVRLAADYEGYYVYNSAMEYLGQANQMLPYSTKYYLANKKLDVQPDDSDYEDPGRPTLEEPADDGGNGGGGDVADEPVGDWWDGDSPNTGVNPMLRIAVAGLVLSGAVLGACVAFGRRGGRNRRSAKK